MLWAAGGLVRAHAARCPDAAAEALEIGNSTLCVVMDDADSARRSVLHVWVERSARIVAQYYGHFPAASVRIDLAPMSGTGVGGGRTTREGGLAIRVGVGRDAAPDALANDWVLVHEMIHLALPEVGSAHNWLAEGLAVYVEGVARAQFGNRSAADVWAEDRRSMPQGLPKRGEGGMDQTSTWARTYWGGALFCLEADVRMREKSGNRVGLQTALRAILNATGGYASERELSEVLKAGDAATGTRVLEELYREYREAPAAPDLDLIWARLGVPEHPETQPFDDGAPLAPIRRAITTALPAADSRP